MAMLTSLRTGKKSDLAFALIAFINPRIGVLTPPRPPLPSTPLAHPKSTKTESVPAFAILTSRILIALYANPIRRAYKKEGR